MIPCMQRTRKRVQGKNEQTQRCDCLLRCAPECGISILTCGQSLERFLPAFFNKRGNQDAGYRHKHQQRGQWSGLGAKKGCRALGRVLAVLY